MFANVWKYPKRENMKIYHKFLLYKNKWIHPYVRMVLGGMSVVTYLASLLLIAGVVYEHGFTITAEEEGQLKSLYHGVWLVFLADVTLRILLEYKEIKSAATAAPIKTTHVCIAKISNKTP